jgi:hypothetical protein
MLLVVTAEQWLCGCKSAVLANSINSVPIEFWKNRYALPKRPTHKSFPGLIVIEICVLLILHLTFKEVA